MKRFDLDRTYRHGIGMPEIIEFADGRLVRWEDAEKLREALEECVKLLVSAPKATRSMYVGRSSIAWGILAETVCKHARAALSQEQV